MLGATLGVVGGVLELGLGGVWLHLMQRVRIPDDRRPFLAGHAVALALGVAALALGAGRVGSAFAVIAVLGAAAMLGLAAQARQAPKQSAVAVGGPILDFVLPDHTGTPFDLATLRGRPFLLKFFRGHW